MSLRGDNFLPFSFSFLMLSFTDFSITPILLLAAPESALYKKFLITDINLNDVRAVTTETLQADQNFQRHPISIPDYIKGLELVGTDLLHIL